MFPVLVSAAVFSPTEWQLRGLEVLYVTSFTSFPVLLGWSNVHLDCFVFLAVPGVQHPP